MCHSSTSVQVSYTCCLKTAARLDQDVGPQLALLHQQFSLNLPKHRLSWFAPNKVTKCTHNRPAGASADASLSYDWAIVTSGTPKNANILNGKCRTGNALGTNQGESATLFLAGTVTVKTVLHLQISSKSNSWNSAVS
jgi:hypothetical protein